MTNTPSPVVVPDPYVDRRPERKTPWAFEKEVDPRHSALLVVDLQNDFCHPQGAWAKVAQDSSLPGVLANLRALLPCVRRAGMPVLYLRTVFNNWTVSELVADRWRALGIGPVCWEGSWGADFYEIYPESVDRVVSKFRASGFQETDLELTLRAKEVQTLLMAGMAACGGLYETAWEGIARDHPVVLIGDCIAGGSPQQREVLNSVFCHYWGYHAPSARVLQAWRNGA